MRFASAGVERVSVTKVERSRKAPKVPGPMLIMSGVHAMPTG